MLRTGWNIILVVILVLISLSCSSDTNDSDIDMATYDINAGPQVTTETISEIIFQNGFLEFSQALEYVNEELYTALIEIFETGTDLHTVFIPTDEAFYKLYDCLGMKTRDISEIGNPGLVRDILLYHVIRERFPLDSLVQNDKNQMVKTYYGEFLTIKSDASIESIGITSFIDVNQSNKMASNGIVHVINDVLLPVEISCKDSDG